MLIGAVTIASDTFWGAGNILTGGIFNNTDFMQGVIQRNNALYEGLYQSAGELTGKLMYYGAHPDEAVKDTKQTLSDYRQQREILFARGQYEEAGRRDGKLGTEAALFAAPAVMGAVKLARGERIAGVEKVITAEKVVEAELDLSLERKLSNTRKINEYPLQNTFPLTQDKINEIVSIPKGERPDPSTYLSQERVKFANSLWI